MNELATKKTTKIFISHSSKDVAFVEPLVELFEHIGLNEENMFCSSVPGINIPLGNHIYDYLREQFQNYSLIVIYVLSENYYNSPDCLCEMGAAWVLQHQYRSILLPQFDYRDVRGVISQMNISIKLDSKRTELTARLNDLRDMMLEELELGKGAFSLNVWEHHRDSFIDRINEMNDYWKELDRLRKANRPFEEWIFPLERLIKKNEHNYDARYMLGTIYAELKDFENAEYNLKMVVESSANMELRDKAKKKLESVRHSSHQ